MKSKTLHMTGEIFIYQIRMGSLGEYVFCATSFMDLYKRIFHGEERLKWEILRNRDNTAFISFEEFKENWEKYITRTPFHLGYLGGYSEQLSRLLILLIIQNSLNMNVQELQPFECVRLTEGTGGSSMHVIKGKEDEIFITRDTEVKRVKPDPSNKDNQYVYEHFSKISGEKADTKTVITGIRTTSHDWYSLLMCELIFKGLNNEEDQNVL